MTNQFIAHADAPRTFADEKGAKKAIKRDLNKHFEAHGDVLYDTGFDVKPTGERFGVVVYCDLTPDAAAKLVGDELAGYVIEPQLKAEPKPKAEATKKRRSGEVNVEPMDTLIQARAGSKQQAIIDLLVGGATMDDLRTVCVKRDTGEPWDDNSIRSALYYDVHQKGYGVRTVWSEEEPSTPTYFLVLPEGVEEPMGARKPKGDS